MRSRSRLILAWYRWDEQAKTAARAQWKTTSSAIVRCPSGSGTHIGDSEQQFDDLVGYVLSDPPQTQECDWNETPHPPFRKYEAVTVEPGPDCP